MQEKLDKKPSVIIKFGLPFVVAVFTLVGLAAVLVNLKEGRKGSTSPEPITSFTQFHKASGTVDVTGEELVYTNKTTNEFFDKLFDGTGVGNELNVFKKTRQNNIVVTKQMNGFSAGYITVTGVIGYARLGNAEIAKEFTVRYLVSDNDWMIETVKVGDKYLLGPGG